MPEHGFGFVRNAFFTPKIGGNTFFDVFCLADVQSDSFCVLILIYPWRGRDGVG